YVSTGSPRGHEHHPDAAHCRVCPCSVGPSDTYEVTAVADERARVRLPELDVLRGIAILLVLMAHQPVPKAGQLARFGLTGVDLFFVLSGYLIGGILLAERYSRGQVGVKQFYLKRALRIWPPYYACLAATLAVAAAAGLPARLALPYVAHV